MNNPSNEAQLALLVAAQEALGSKVDEMRDAMHKMANAVQRLAIIDERQTNDREALGRAFKEIEKLQAEVDSLKRDAPIQKHTADWVQRILTQVVSLVVAAAAGSFIATRVAPGPTVPGPKHESQTTQ